MKLSVQPRNESSPRLVDVGPEGLKLAAQPGATYRVVDEKTMKTPNGVVVKRVGDDLVVVDGQDGSGGAPVELQGFFQECTPAKRCWAVLDTPPAGGALGGGAEASTVTITQDGHSLGALGPGQSGGLADGQSLTFAATASEAGGSAIGLATAGAIAGGLALLGLVDGNSSRGGGGGASSGGTAIPLTVKGTVAAGPMKAGTVEVLAYDRDGVLLGRSLVSNDRGEYEIVIGGRGGYSGPVLLVARDANGSIADNYVDEATGNPTDLHVSLGAVGMATGASSTVVISITPLTHLAALEMGLDVNQVGAAIRPPGDPAMIARLNRAVGAFFGVQDILGPVVTINEAGFRAADPAATAHGVALAKLSVLDGRNGGIAGTVRSLSDSVFIDGEALAATQPELYSLGTSRTISRQVDLRAALATAEALDPGMVTQANAARASVVMALPVNSVAGDLVHLTLAGPNGSVVLPAQAVSAQDLLNGYAVLHPTRAQLASAGTGTLRPSAVVTDARGGNASDAIPARDFLVDVVEPSPVLSLPSGQPSDLGAGMAQVIVNLSYAGLAAGDTVQLMLGSAALGGARTVSAAEAASGMVVLNVERTALGADGIKSLSAVVSDAAGNVGTGAALNLRVDTSAPVPAVALQSGQSAQILATDTRVGIDVVVPGVVAGDLVAVSIDGVVFRQQVVTAAQAAAGVVEFAVPKSTLGEAGTKSVVATAVDAAGNRGASATLSLTVLADGDAPAPSATVRAGEDARLNAGEATLGIDVSYPGISAGDTITLWQMGNPSPRGQARTVTAAEALAGALTLVVDKTLLGGDGPKNLLVLLTDTAGRSNVSAPLAIELDSLAPSPRLSVKAGEDNVLNSAETGVTLEVRDSAMAVGDTLQLQLGGAPLGTPHVVTAAEVAAGVVALVVSRASLGADGTKNVVVASTDAAGNAGTSTAVALVLDSISPAPVLSVRSGEDTFLGAAESSVHLEVRYAGLAAGDVVQLKLGATNLGTAYTVTAADVAGGFAAFDVASSSLGADGLKNITATATAGNASTGTSATLALTLDTAVPSPSLSIAAGEEARLGASEAALHLRLDYAGAAVGDVVQLRLAGSPLGAPHAVTAAEVAAGTLALTVARSDLGADGAKSLDVTVTDRAGNAGASAALSVTLDSVAPAPVLSIPAGQDALLGAGEAQLDLSIAYAGIAAGDVVQLKLAGANLGSPHTVTAAEALAGSASVAVDRSSLGGDGSKSVVASVTDMAGNNGNSPALALVLDSSAPAPVLAVRSGEDAVLGASEASVHLGLSYPGLAAGDVVQLQLGGVNLGSPYTVTDADVTAGSATLDVSRASLGADGAKSLTAIATDPSGNAGTSTALVLTVDTTPPAPVLAILAGEDASLNALDNGVDLTVAYAGLAAGDLVQLRLGGANLGTAYTVTSADVTAGFATLAVSRASLGADGGKSLTAVATDTAGNAGTSTALALTLDTTPPAPVLAIASGEDAYLNAAETVLHLQVAYPGLVAGDVIQLQLAGSNLGAARTVTPADVTQGFALFDVTRASLGADGVKNLTAVAVDAAGNSGTSTTFPVTVDTTPPAPVLSVHAGEDGYLNAVESAVNIDVAYPGLAVGDVIQLRLSGGNLGAPHTVTAQDVSAGYAVMNVTRASLGADGSKGLTAVATDLAGNTGTGSGGLTLVLDSLAPSPVVSVASGEDPYLGASETSIHLQVGYANIAAGDTVQLTVDGVPLGAIYAITGADATRGFAVFDVSKASLGADGEKHVVAAVTDAGSHTGLSATLTVTVDGVVPAPVLAVKAGQDALLGTAETGVDLSVTDAGLRAGDVLQLKLAGVDLGSPYTVTAADVLAGSATLHVDKAGLGADGLKSVTVQATDLAGNTGAGGPLALTVDGIAPVPVLALQAGQDSLLNAGETSVPLTVTYAGLAEGDTVQLRFGGADLGVAYTVTAADVIAGSATVSLARASLGADGVYGITALVTDTAGNAGSSAAVPITVDTGAPVPVLALAAGQDAFLNNAETGIVLTIAYPGLAAGDVLQPTLAGANLGAAYTVTAADVLAGSVSLTVTKASLGADGLKGLGVLATDAAGNTGTGGPLSVTVDTAAPTPVLGVHAGQNAIVNGLETGVDIDVAYPGLQAGDTVQLTLAGNPLGGPHTVTAAEALAGTLSLTVSKASLGADGAKALTAVVTDVAGNTGNSATLALSVDTSAPAVLFSDSTGALLKAAGSGSLGSLNGGVAMVDASSSVTDGGGTVAVTQLQLSLSGFANGGSETLAIGNAVLHADGSGTPATVTANGRTWSVVAGSGGFTFSATGGNASAADVAALMQSTYNNLAGTVTDGQRVLGYTVTDAAGNVSNTATASVLVSTVPPNITPVISAISHDTGLLGDFRTTVAAQSLLGTFTGTVNSGDRIQVSTDNATWVDATITGSGTWLGNGITLLSGTHTLYVRTIDLAGNASVAVSQNYTLDAAAIATTATIGGASENTVANGSASGSFASGTSTDGGTPILSGTLSAALTGDQVVALYDNVGGSNVRLGQATVTGSNWTFTTPALALGGHSLTAVVESPSSGASSSASGAFVVNEQSITLVATDGVGGTQGAITNGGVTDDSRPALSGTLGSTVLGSGEVVAVYDGATKLGNANVSGNTWSFTPGVALSEGAHTLTALIGDGSTGTATNGRVVATPLSLTVDTAGLAPTQTVTSFTATEATTANGSVSGSFASGTSTDGRTPTLSGTLSAALGAAQVLAIYDTVQGVTSKLGTATVTGSNWTFTTASLSDGTHSLVAVAESAASGAQGTPSGAFVINEQSIAITGIQDSIGITIGNLIDNDFTDDNQPDLSGSLGNATLGAGEVVAVYDGNTKLGNATVNGSSWTFTPGAPLVDGNHTLRAMVQDGSTGTATSGRVVSADTHLTVLTLLGTPAQTVTLASVTEGNTANGSVSGGFASGTSTDGATPTLSGTINAVLGIGEVVAVYDGSTRLGLATVTAGTNWSFTTPALALGSHSLTVRVDNILSGDHGAATAPFVVIEQSIAVSGLVDDVGSTQGAIAAAGVTDDSRPTFSGTLGSATLGTGEVVAVYDGSTKLGNATVTGTGWTFTPGTALSDGAHSLHAVVQDGSTGTATTGRVGTASSAFTVNTSAVVPTQTVGIGSVTENTTTNGSVTGAIANGTSTDGRTPTLNGTLSASLDPGQAVVVYDGATRLGTATTVGTGWSFTTPTLALGSHALTAVVENQGSGARGTPSAAFNLIEQSVSIDNLLGITGSVEVLVGGILGVVLGTNPTFTGLLGSATLGTNEVVAVYDGSTKLGNATLNGNTWGFTPASPLGTGFHQLSVMIQDAGTVNVNAGRAVGASTGLTVDISLLVPPQTVTIDYAIESTATNGSVIGSFASGSATDSPTPTLGGSISSTLTGAQVVAVYDGATKLGNATVVGASWSFTTPTLATGSHNLQVRVENPVTGSHGPNSANFTVNLQTISATTVTDDVGTLTGSVANLGVTDDNRPTLSGTLGSTSLGLLESVAIYDTYGGVTTRIGSALVTGNSWSFTPLFLLPLADGQHRFQAMIQSSLSLSPSTGQVVSAPITVNIDTSSTPTQLVGVNAVVDDYASGSSRTGLVVGLGTLDDTTPTISGTLTSALTGAQALAVYDTLNGVKTQIGYATIGSNPLTWSFTPGTDLAAGTHLISARVENTASGSLGIESLPYIVTERPVTLKVIDNVGALQGDVLGFGNGGVTDDTSLVLSGSIGVPLGLVGGLLEQVRVYDNGALLGTATVTGTDWNFNLSGLTANSTHNLSVRISDVLGNYTVATGGTVKVAASDLPATAPDSTHASLGAVVQVAVGGEGNLLDLTRISGIAQPAFDVVQLGSGGNTLKVGLADVLQAGTNLFNGDSGWAGLNGTGRHQLIVEGSVGTVTGTDSTWSSVGVATHAGITYQVYEDPTHLAQLLIDSHLTRTGTLAG